MADYEALLKATNEQHADASQQMMLEMSAQLAQVKPAFLRALLLSFPTAPGLSSHLALADPFLTVSTSATLLLQESARLVGERKKHEQMYATMLGELGELQKLMTAQRAEAAQRQADAVAAKDAALRRLAALEAEKGSEKGDYLRMLEAARESEARLAAQVGVSRVPPAPRPPCGTAGRHIFYEQGRLRTPQPASSSASIHPSIPHPPLPPHFPSITHARGR